MPHSIFTLNNGLKIIHKEINSPISHFGVLINAGSRDESINHMGLAHFVEHTIFKATDKRKGYQIIKRMEDVGGDLNASTSKEETYFHASFLSQDYERAIELLSDIFFNATFPDKEIEKEKDVVLEEINYYKDSPSELIIDDFEDLVFAGHPLGRNILGTKKTVSSFKRDVIIKFIKENYTVENIVLASVGSISLHKLLKFCEKYFGSNPLHVGSHSRQPFTSYKPEFLKLRKKTNQTHVMIGNLAYSLKEDQKNAFMLLTNLLGGQGMNTRLNMAIREKMGLAYSVEANYSPFSDSGLFNVYIGCDNGMWEKCIDLTYKELDKLKGKKLGTMQLQYAKKQFIGQLAISNESKLNEMLSIGRSALFFDEVDTMEEVIQKFLSVTADDILEVANDIFDKDKFSILIFSKN